MARKSNSGNKESEMAPQSQSLTETARKLALVIDDLWSFSSSCAGTESSEFQKIADALRRQYKALAVKAADAYLMEC